MTYATAANMASWWASTPVTIAGAGGQRWRGDRYMSWLPAYSSGYYYYPSIHHDLVTFQAEKEYDMTDEEFESALEDLFLIGQKEEEDG